MEFYHLLFIVLIIIGVIGVGILAIWYDNKHMLDYTDCDVDDVRLLWSVQYIVLAEDGKQYEENTGFETKEERDAYIKKNKKHWIDYKKYLMKLPK